VCLCVFVCVKLDTRVLYSILYAFYSLLPGKFEYLVLFPIVRFPYLIFLCMNNILHILNIILHYFRSN